ncbi:hypothetical protein ACQPZX_30430 [Actinoplanes sp. CA-142083]|uniref:hypothetical protein n=1 Tax=Actinoplanes sp. CA-142083 TaxID=3239903 RepID=UPI003D915EF0
MDLTPVMVTTLGGALSATLGVLVGGAVTRRVQERHWLRDRQLLAYQELFAQYSRFMMALRRAHLDRRGVDVDWASWSAALTAASLVAPLEVAQALDQFAKAVAVFLGRVATRDPATNPVDEKGLTEASRPAAEAHLALLNTIRRSLGRTLGDMPFFLGGTLGDQPEGFADQGKTVA